MDAATANLKQARDENGLGESARIPSDLVLASGSGLDPDITPAAANLQVARIAKERSLEPGEVHRLLAQHIQERQWVLLGEPRINVLELNLALDALQH